MAPTAAERAFWDAAIRAMAEKTEAAYLGGDELSALIVAPDWKNSAIDFIAKAIADARPEEIEIEVCNGARDVSAPGDIFSRFEHDGRRTITIRIKGGANADGS